MSVAAELAAPALVSDSAEGCAFPRPGQPRMGRPFLGENTQRGRPQGYLSACGQTAPVRAAYQVPAGGRLLRILVTGHGDPHELGRESQPSPPTSH